MMHEDKTEVLVVGAGPVGMLTALVLAEEGIEVKVIDQEFQRAARSYACVLHPRTLRILHRLGLSAEVLQLGQRVDAVAFYEGPSRRAEVQLAKLPLEFPFLVALPQSALEELLERRLSEQRGVRVQWNHRLAALHADDGAVVATVERLAETAKGYIVPSWEWTVDKTLQTRASFVVGADGHDSKVRPALGLDCESFGAPASFEVFEFTSGGKLDAEMRVVFHGDTANVLWPLSVSKCRWSFQVPVAEGADPFPRKERSGVTLVETERDRDDRRHVERFLRERAPWFAGSVGEFHWSSDVQFERRLARQFGHGRCWLAGDAAHQTNPIGAQSMNVGLQEAEALATVLRKILREKAPLDLLAAYGQGRQDEWQRLLGHRGALTSTGQAEAWVQAHAERMLSCLPASGDDLALLLRPLGLELR